MKRVQRPKGRRTPFGRIVYQVMRDWLRAELGKPPGAYWMVILWAAVGVTLMQVLLSMFRSFLLMSGSFIARIPSNAILPAAIVATALHWLSTRAAPVARTRQAAVVVLAAVLAMGVYLVPANLLILPTLLGAEILDAVSWAATGAWPAITLAGTFALAASRRHRLPIGLQISTVGAVAGAMLTIVLAYPVYTTLFNIFVPGVEHTDQYYERAVLGSVLVAVLLILSIGPVAVAWMRPRSRWGQLGVGAAAGGMSGAVLFGLLGAPAAGLAAQGPLYGVALSRAGYGGGDWVLKLGIAINVVFPAILGTTWLLVGCSALVGGITGLLMPTRSRRERQAPSPNLDALLFDLVGGSVGNSLQTGLILVVVLSIMVLLSSSIQNILDSVGVAPRWSPSWSLSALSGQLWLILTLLQVGALVWTRRHLTQMTLSRLPKEVHQTLVWSVRFQGAVWILFSVLSGYLIGPELSDLSGLKTALLIMTALGIEIILSVPRLPPGESTPDDSEGAWSRPPIWDPDRRPWTAAGLMTGTVVGILSYQLIAISVSLVLVAIPMISELDNVSAPPPGLDWLNEILLGYLHTFSFPSAFVMLTVAHAVMGLSVESPVYAPLRKIRARLLAEASRDRTPERTTHPIVAWGRTMLRSRHAGRVAGGVLLAAAICGGVLFGDGALLTIALATAAAFFLLRDWDVERLSWPVLASAFAITLMGLLGMALRGPYRLPLDALWLRLIYVLLVGPAAVMTYRALVTYLPSRSRPRTRLTALLGVSVLVGLLGYASQEAVTIQSSVSRFRQREQLWEEFTSGDTPIGGLLNYHFFSDSQERLWLGGGTGVIVERAGEEWRSYLARYSVGNRDRPRGELLSARLRFLEDRRARLWVAEDTTFGLFDPGYFDEQTRESLRIPTDAASEIELTLESPVSDMALDTAGDIWVATAGSGVLRVEGGREPDDARWEFFTVDNSGLSSDRVVSLHTDQAGNLWLGTVSGLNRFDGTDWELITVPGLGAGAPVVTFLDDSYGRLWIGTSGGGYRWDGQTWTAFEDLGGWPGGTGVTTLFEDSQGGLWAGTETGALRFDGREWVNLVPDVRVTVFEGGRPEDGGAVDLVWIGAREGLIQYDLREGAVRLSFNSADRGLAADWVRDLHMDSGGGLWISTFAIDLTPRSPWWAIGLSIVFFGYLFVNSYRGYERSPETRARRIGRQVAGDPDSLYRAAYNLMTEAPDAPVVLAQLAGHLARAGDPTGADVVAALAALPSDRQGPEIDGVLNQSIAALAADSTRAWGGALSRLHSLLAAALVARRVPEIADLELAVNPGREAGSIALQWRGESVEALPPFLPGGSAEGWRALERVGVVLRKYQEVDTAADRLSYLAQALTTAEAAQSATRSVRPPEGVLMAAIADRWRAAVTREIDAVSGRAELRVELRTRQVRVADKTTLALRLHNSGRATAENVSVTLEPSDSFSFVSDRQARLARLSSGRSALVEFVIAPADVETVRIVCHATWDDRVAVGNRIEFADAVRFYEAVEEFHPIPNLYIVGHPVKSSEMFHGRDDVFRFIADNISGPVQDRTLVLHGQRRTGKTSILYQLLQGRLGDEFVPVLVDMQELALLVNSTGDFLSELAYQLARTARKAGVAIEEPSMETLAASPTRVFNRFLDMLADSLGDRRVVVMFDEFELIESKITEGKLDADILGYFRSLMQHRDRFLFIFTGTHQLEEMSHDYWSIFFNIALYRRISFLTPAEATRLIREPVADHLDVDELAVEKIITLTSGHPYFVQLICWALVNHCNAQKRSYATINDVNEVVQEILMTGEAHFAYIWHQATDAERLALAGLAHTLGPDKTWGRPTEVLKTLAAGGDTQTQQAELVDVLDRLVAQEVLEVARQGALRYRFQLDVLRLWVEVTKSVAALVERQQ